MRGIPTGITQNIKDLLASRRLKISLKNSDFYPDAEPGGR